MGCLFALFAGLLPRHGLFTVWLARPVLVDTAFNTFVAPLLGIGHWGASYTQRNQVSGMRRA